MSNRRSLCTVLAVALASSAFAQTRPVTDNPHEFTNLNVEAVRGVLWSSVNGWIYALNTNLSQVVIHSNLDGIPDFTWQTLSMPTAIAEWQTNRILVVGGGTHALAIHDRTTGAILDVVQLDSEPADIVVDPDLGVAFIACQGDDVVDRVDLTTLQKTAVLVASERPRFLYFDPGAAAGAADNRVFVAPFLSGNNSLTVPLTQPLTPAHPAQDELVRVMSLAGAPAQMPDEDLFVMTTAVNGAFQAALHGAGTLLAAHGKNPATGEYWMLNIEARNAHPTLDTEPELNGQFAFNRLSVGAPSTTAPVPAPARIIDIDDIDPTSTVAYSPTSSRAFPFGLAFHPLGYAVVSASMSDRIAAFAPDGSRLLALDIVLPDGSIPRHLQFEPLYSQYLAVHCTGTNVVQICQPGVSTTPLVTLSLGLDPAPKIIKQGREIWYDADRSLHGRTSCNTCHPSGKADGVAWMISNPPHDHKDAMVTQSLLSIEDTFPFHWRGERDLLQFNGAFTGLLGGSATLTEGPNSEFEKFQAFVFSLQGAANPYEDQSRAVTASAGTLPSDPPITSAANGDLVYRTVPSFGSFTCNDCHTLPTGTSGDHQLSIPRFVPSMTSIEVAHFREMRHKDTPFIAGTIVPRSGFGVTHDGLIANIQGAANVFVPAISAQQAFDVAAFLRQFDNGLAPAAHLAFRLDPSNAAAIAALLHPQVTSGGLDVVAIGEANIATIPTPVRWLFDRGSGLYVPNESGLPSLTLAQLAPGAGPNSAIRAVVLGLPPGNGERFARDTDDDGLIDSAETTAGTDRFNPDSDNDTFPDGYEVANGSSPTNSASLPNDQAKPDFILTPVNGQPRLDFATSSLAKFVAESTEDALVSVTWSAPGIAMKSYVSPYFTRRHTIVLQGLEPSLTVLNYTATFTLIDRAGLKSQPRSVAFNSLPIKANPSNSGISPESIRVTTFTGVRQTGSPTGTLQVRSTQAQLQLREPGIVVGANVTGKQVVAQVLIRRAGTTTWQVSTNPTSPNASIVPTFTLGGGAFFPSAPFPVFLILPNTFLISAPTGANGIASIDFDQTGLNANDEVHLRIMAILKTAATNPPDFLDVSIGIYSMMSTPDAARALKFNF